MLYLVEYQNVGFLMMWLILSWQSMWGCYINLKVIEFITWASFWENQSYWFPTRSKTNQAGQLLKMVDLKFSDLGRRGIVLYVFKNKVADQHYCYREADLRYLFCICKYPVLHHETTVSEAYPPGQTQIRLCIHRRWLEFWNFGSSNYKVGNNKGTDQLGSAVN